MNFDRICEWEKGNAGIHGREEIIDQKIKHLPHQKINYRKMIGFTL